MGIKTILLLYLYPQRYKMNLSEFLKQRRREHNLTQEDLAAKAGVGLRLVREIEQGKTSMRMDKVNQILELFGANLKVTPKTKSND
jgi:y4mF family transcriptional regulator